MEVPQGFHLPFLLPQGPQRLDNRACLWGTHVVETSCYLISSREFLTPADAVSKVTYAAAMRCAGKDFDF
jgi:hypothetical protein